MALRNGCYLGAVLGFPGGEEVEKCFPIRRNSNPDHYQRAGRVLLTPEITLPPAPRPQPPEATELLRLVLPLRTQVNHT